MTEVQVPLLIRGEAPVPGPQTAVNTASAAERLLLLYGGGNALLEWAILCRDLPRTRYGSISSCEKPQSRRGQVM